MELNDILLLLEKFESSDLTSLQVKLKGDEFQASRNGGELQGEAEAPLRVLRERREEAPVPVKEAAPGAAPMAENLYEVTSPLVGTFYSRPSENDAPFVKVGQSVKKGDILCILEAMKIMNEVKSPVDGIIRKVCLEDKDMADFGKVLFLLEEA
jgi:acetyl-CoA carboxylase biotin carboxyl carrier protein